MDQQNYCKTKVEVDSTTFISYPNAIIVCVCVLCLASNCYVDIFAMTTY